MASDLCNARVSEIAGVLVPPRLLADLGFWFSDHVVRRFGACSVGKPGGSLGALQDGEEDDVHRLRRRRGDVSKPEAAATGQIDSRDSARQDRLGRLDRAVPKAAYERGHDDGRGDHCPSSFDTRLGFGGGLRSKAEQSGICTACAGPVARCRALALRASRPPSTTTGAHVT